MAVAVHRLHHTVSAAAAGPSLLAVATPTNDVVIYSWPECRQVAQLEGHEATVAGLAFAASGSGGGSGPLRLVSASHDRNAFVWTQQPGSSGTETGGKGSVQQELWRPEMVITKLTKAGLCCAWAPGGRK